MQLLTGTIWSSQLDSSFLLIILYDKYMKKSTIFYEAKNKRVAEIATLDRVTEIYCPLISLIASPNSSLTVEQESMSQSINSGSVISSLSQRISITSLVSS